MSDLIEPHDPLPDCDCGPCALVERNRLRLLLKGDPRGDGVMRYGVEALLKRAVLGARPQEPGRSYPRWVGIHDVFSLGSTFSAELLRLHHVDADELRAGPECESCAAMLSEDE